MIIKQIFETIGIIENKISQYESNLMGAAKALNIQQIEGMNKYIQNALKLKEEIENYDLSSLNIEELEMLLMKARYES